MSRAALKLPAGWSSIDTLTYAHVSGAIVDRHKNPETGLIEWRTRARGRTIYSGQDLASALEVAT